jgi:transcription elongation factor Elf1
VGNGINPCPRCGARAQMIAEDPAAVNHHLAICVMCGGIVTSTRIQAAMQEVISTLLTAHRRSRSLLS